MIRHPEKKDHASTGLLETYKIETDSQREKWDRLLADSEQATPFAAVEWLSALRDAAGIESDIWTALIGDDIVAGVPVFYIRRRNRKQCLLPPLTPYTSFIYRNPIGKYPSRISAQHITISQSLIVRLTREYSALRHLLHPSIDDTRPWLWYGWSGVPRYSYLLDLKSELKTSHAVRKQTKKCDNAGYSVSHEWDLDRFWHIYTKTQKRQSFGIDLSPHQFSQLSTRLHDTGLIAMVNAVSPNNAIVASRLEVFLPGTDTLYDWVAGSDPNHLSSGVNPWLIMKIADIFRSNGFFYWDLCGADFESIARFKSEFGGQLVHYFQVDAPAPLSIKVWQTVKRSLKKFG